MVIDVLDVYCRYFNMTYEKKKKLNKPKINKLKPISFHSHNFVEVNSLDVSQIGIIKALINQLNTNVNNVTT